MIQPLTLLELNIDNMKRLVLSVKAPETYWKTESSGLKTTNETAIEIDKQVDKIFKFLHCRVPLLITNKVRDKLNARW